MIINLKTPLANKAFGCIFGAFLGKIKLSHIYISFLSRRLSRKFA